MRTVLTIAAVMVLAPLAVGAVGQQDESGFISIFNGKDLSGWVYGRQQGGGYQINPEQKVLFSTPSDGGNLYTEKEYGDFVFRFEFKLTPNANNGIGIRAPLQGDAAYVGMEIQVLDDSGSAYTSLRPEQYHGSIYDLVACKRGSQRPVGEWNEEEIAVKGSKVKVTLNGTVIVDADLGDIKDEQKLQRHPGVKNTKGHLGFLGHGARVEFRNLRVKEL